MAWKDLRTIKEMPLGMALGTVAKMITGQNMNIKPRQLKSLQDDKLEEFQINQEAEHEKLFMIFANHFTAPEDVQEAREDFWGFVNYIYGTHTFRTYVNMILSRPDIVEALITIYMKDEAKLQDLTYQLDRRTDNVKKFGAAISTNPEQLATLIEGFTGDTDKFIEQLRAIKAEVKQPENTDDAAESSETGSEQNNEMKEAV
tara:strand:+ start:223835 stop:224440 length:606 start_codon:yes stop_codon:yes gene_type:complete